MINKNEREWLKKAILNGLLPEFKRLGFEIYSLPSHIKGKSAKVAYPFGILRRYKEKTVDIVEISLSDPGRRASFGIWFGIVPITGYDHPYRDNYHYSVEELYIVYLQQYFIAYQCRFIDRWFSLWHWPGRNVKEIDYVNLIRKVTMKIIPEIEEVFISGNVGKHIRRIDSRG